MSPLATIVAIALLAAALALAVVILRFRRKCLDIARCAASATHEQLERIYSLIEQTGTITSNGYVLARTNETVADTRCLIPIPPELPDFPWSGRSVEIRVSKSVTFQFIESTVREPSLLGNLYRPVRVPRHQTKTSSKARNTFSPDRYIANNRELPSALSAVCGKYPNELLSYLLCVGRSSFEFEPIDQARIGTTPAWVQEPEHQLCDTCKKRMRLVLQLPGTIISKKAFGEATIYLFGCVAHPEQTKTVTQFA